MTTLPRAHRRPATDVALATLALLAATGPLALGDARAQAPAGAWPTKPVRMIVGFSAGSNSDSLARPLAQRLSEVAGQPVVVDNRPGASGNIAMEIVAKSAPDGHTLFSGPGSSVTTNPHMHAKMPIDVLRDLLPIVPLGQFSALLVVHPSLPARSVKELVALARSKPGMISFGSPGHGTGFHLATELFKVRAGFDAVHVPYANSSAMLSDLIGGRIEMMIFSAIVMAPHVKTGKLRALATTGRERSSVLPDLPTIAQAGVPDYEYTAFHGLFGPGGMSRDTAERVNAVVAKVLALPDVREFYASQNVDPMVMSPADFTARVRAEHDKWGRLIRDAGIKATL
jgi:tripartite-type tricarboxylate transporter receptor subunit TctC